MDFGPRSENRIETSSPLRSAKSRRALFCLCLVALPFFLVDLGAPALEDGEAMYAEIAREMRLSGDWVTPHLNGTVHFDKPPLLYWLIAAGQEVAGESEVTARLWSSLATWATIPVVGALGATLYGAEAGLLGALVFATSLGPFVYARLTQPDGLLVLWVSLAILGYVRGFVRDEGRGPWPWVMWASLGLAPLTKGLVALGPPCAVILLHAALTRRLTRYLSWRFAAGAALFALIAVPWHVAAERAHPDFLSYYFIREHLGRLTGHRFPRDEFLSLPAFLGFTLLWTFPWLAAVPPALWRGIRRRDLLPLLWIGVVVGVFSISSSRLEYYALPAMPAFALLAGRLWEDVLGESGSSSPGLQAGLIATAAVSALGAAAAFIALGPGKETVLHAIAAGWPTAGWTGDPAQLALLNRIRWPAAATLAAAAVMLVGVGVAARRSRFRVALGLLAGSSVLFFPLIHWGFRVAEPFRTTRPLAEAVRRDAGPRDLVVFPEPHELMWVGGITFYAKRPVVLLEDPRLDGIPGVPREPADHYLNLDQLLAQWRSDRRVLVVAEAGGKLERTLLGAHPGTVLARQTDRIVLCNHPARGAAASEGVGVSGPRKSPERSD